MTLKYLMSLEKSEEKDQVMTAVMIKIMDKS
jgi:hypothetical protein